MHVTYRYDMSEPDERAEQRIMDRAMELHGAAWDVARAAPRGTAGDAARAAAWAAAWAARDVARAAAGDVEMQWQSERVRAILNRAEPEK